jgi:hypothetical protein
MQDPVLELDASKQVGEQVKDSRSGLEFGVLDVTLEDGIPVWDLDTTFLEKTGGADITEADKYTHIYWIKWRKDNSGWRTLFRHSQDHCAIVQTGTRNLGVYSNRDGGFVDSGFDIVPDEWMFLAVVGKALEPGSHVGDAKMYVGGPTEPLQELGDPPGRVCSGESYYRIGWSVNISLNHACTSFVLTMHLHLHLQCLQCLHLHLHLHVHVHLHLHLHLHFHLPYHTLTRVLTDCAFQVMFAI